MPAEVGQIQSETETSLEEILAWFYFVWLVVDVECSHGAYVASCLQFFVGVEYLSFWLQATSCKLQVRECFSTAGDCNLELAA